MTVKIDESQEGIKVWTERNLLSQTTLVKCSASRTVGEVLARMREHSVVETKHFLEQMANMSGKNRDNYMMMVVLGLTFEGEPLSEADTLEKCGITDGAHMSAMTNMQSGQACCIGCTDSMVPDGAYYMIDGKVKQKAAGDQAAVAPEGPILMVR